MRIKDKIEEIENYIYTLNSFIPGSFEDYKKDEKTKAACEHYFEKIIESLADLAFLTIKSLKLPTPKDDVQAFFILSQENIISKELAEKLKDAKGMRNILAHEYGSVDDELVFEAITTELGQDINEFLNKIKLSLNRFKK